MRWKKGAPKQLYVVVDDAVGDIEFFETDKQRKHYMYCTYGNGPYKGFTFMTYIQKEKK